MDKRTLICPAGSDYSTVDAATMVEYDRGIAVSVRFERMVYWMFNVREFTMVVKERDWNNILTETETTRYSCVSPADICGDDLGGRGFTFPTNPVGLSSASSEGDGGFDEAPTRIRVDYFRGKWWFIIPYGTIENGFDPSNFTVSGSSPQNIGRIKYTLTSSAPVTTQEYTLTPTQFNYP